jgi:hypothetical protein
MTPRTKAMIAHYIRSKTKELSYYITELKDGDTELFLKAQFLDDEQFTLFCIDASKFLYKDV